MPQVIVFTPQTRVLTKLRQSDTWNVCLSSFSPDRSKGVAGCGVAVGTGVGGAGGRMAGVVDGVGVAGTPGNAPGSTTPISDWGLHFLNIETSWYRAMVWNLSTNTWWIEENGKFESAYHECVQDACLFFQSKEPTSSILIKMSRPLPFSCSDLDRMQSTKLSSSLQDMVWMLLGSDSSSMFFAKSWTASDRSVRGRFWRTWWTRSARVL